MLDSVMKQCVCFVFRLRPMTAMIACSLLLSSGLVLGAPSKRAVAPGEVVPQEDALMQGEHVQLPAAAQNSGDAGATPTGTAQATGEGHTPLASQGGQVQVMSMHNPDDRRYAAVKTVENGVWFKFSEGQSYLPDSANTALNHVARLKPGQYLVIATYFDPQLKVSENEELAKARAESIKQVLLALKISSERVVMLKPRVSQEQHSFAHAADRVEVGVEEGNKYSEVDTFK